jgi:hypothetical protein
LTAVLLLLLAACTSHGQSAGSVSHSVWRISENEVILQVSFPKAQGASLKGELHPLSIENLGKYVLDRVSVTSGADTCPAVDQGYDIGEVDPLALGETLYGFEIIFSCPDGNGAGTELTLRNGLFFAERSAHTDFAFIVKDGVTVSDIFTASRQFLSVPKSGALAGAGRGRFARLGLSHLWRSADQWLALGGFFLILRGRNWLAAALACLSGYLLAAAAVTEGRLIPYGDAAGVGMGLVVAGLAMVLVSRAVNDSKAFSPVLALALFYGVVDGLTLPTDFVRLQIWGDLSAMDLLAYAAGALLSAMLFMALLAGGRRLLRKKWSVTAFAEDFASAALAGFGVFWIVSRLL